MKLFDHFFNKDGDPTPRGGKVESFSRVLLRLSGMRITEEYEIVPDGDGARITHYFIRYDGKEDRREPQRSARRPIKDVLALLNDCDVPAWDGFHGKHPKFVTDGTMFRFEATVNGDRRIFADGSENFPKHFRDFREGLSRLSDPTCNSDNSVV